MALIFEPEHYLRILEETQTRFKDKPTIDALVRALIEGIQLFEDLAYDYTTSSFLDLAEDYLLDRLGAFVGAQRLGATDDEFRKIIRARVAAQRSNGTIGEIGHVLDLLVNASLLEYFSAYPAGYRYYFVPAEGTLTEGERRRARRVLELTRPAGVSADFVEAAGSDEETFRFDVSPGFGRKFGRIL